MTRKPWSNLLSDRTSGMFLRLIGFLLVIFLAQVAAHLTAYINF